MTAYKTHGCIRRTPISAGQNQEKNLAEQSVTIKRDEINVMNIINDNSFNMHNSIFNNGNRYIKVTIKSKLIRIAS